MEVPKDGLFSDAIVYSLNSSTQSEYDNLLTESVLLFQLAGTMVFETSNDRITAHPGDVYLVRKHQFVKSTKLPQQHGQYQALLFILKESALREYALENRISYPERYVGDNNILLNKSPYMDSFIASLHAYVNYPKPLDHPFNTLKLQEAIELILSLNPDVQELLFDFSEPHKIDLEKFMSSNFKFNVRLDYFAKLTGRSLATFKRDFQQLFGQSPRRWLLEKRLQEAHFQLQKNNTKPSTLYLELGFESFAHFSDSFKKRFGYSPKEARASK